MAAKINMLTPEDKAEEICVSVETLRRWRKLGKGPVYRKFGPQVIRYWPETEEAAA